MLILTRKPSERICIGDDIVVYVCRVRGKIATIGIEAPKDIRVHRGEVHDAIKSNATPPDDYSLAIAIAGVISRAAEGGAE